MSEIFINLSVKTKSDSAWPAAFGTMADFAMEHAEEFSYVSLSSTDADDLMNGPEEDIRETFTDETMTTVRTAIRQVVVGCGMEYHNITDDEATSIITSLQNAGILFRERMP